MKVRDLSFLALAAVIGWWAHGAGTHVLAQRSTSESSRAAGENALNYQFGGTTLQGSLTLYSPSNRTLYVYPTTTNNGRISCAYSITVERPGAPIERRNCAPGDTFGH